METELLIALITTTGVVFGAGFWTAFFKSKQIKDQFHKELSEQKDSLLKSDAEQMAKFRDSIMSDNRSLMQLVDQLRKELTDAQALYAEAKAHILVLEARVSVLEKELHERTVREGT